MLGDSFTDQLGIGFRTFDFVYIDLDIFARDRLKFFLDAIYLTTTFADDNARTSGVDGQRNPLQCALDNHFGNRTLRDTRLDIVADFFVFDQFVGEVLSTVPA